MRLPLSPIPWFVGLFLGHRGLVPEVQGEHGAEEGQETKRDEEERARSETLVEEIAEESEEHGAGDQAQRLAEPVVEPTFGLCPLVNVFANYPAAPPGSNRRPKRDGRRRSLRRLAWRRLLPRHPRRLRLT